MANTGSDLRLGEGSLVDVVFSCDEEFVSFQFYDSGRKVGEARRISRADAVKEGKHVAETGNYEHCPVCVSLDAMKVFGLRLRQYGEDGR